MRHLGQCGQQLRWVRETPDRVRSRLPTPDDRQVQSDLDDTSVEFENMPLDGLRTSLIVDPENGILPPLLPVAQARIGARPKRSLDNPETLGLAERCLVGNFGASGGSLASPPMLPSASIPSFYQIVQTDKQVLIFNEWVHDVASSGWTARTSLPRSGAGSGIRSDTMKARRSSWTRRTSAARHITSTPANAFTSLSASHASTRGRYGIV